MNNNVETTSRSAKCWLVAIVALGLMLRLWGVMWGLPDRNDLHPDEHDYVIGHALKLSFQHPDPGFLNYPAFLMYLVSLTFGALRHLHLISGADWQAYLIGRIWSACFGAATAAAGYLVARELGGSRRAGLLAALWTALLPLSVWESHVAVTDPMMTCWIVMTVWASIRLVRTQQLRDYALAGLFLGLATGSKYTAAMAVVAILTGAALARQNPVATLRGLMVAGIASIASAFCVMPFSFIRVKDTLGAMSYEHQHTMGHHFGFSVPADGWQYHRYLYQLVASWPFSFGWVLYLSALAGTVWLLFRFQRRNLVPIVFGAVFFGILGSWHFVPLRYYLPLVVFGAVFAGLWHDALLGSASRAVRLAAVGLIVATLAYTGLFTAQTTNRFAADTRVTSGAWVAQHLASNDTMIVCGWSRYMGLPANPRHFHIDGRKGEAVFVDFATNRPTALLQISSLVFDRHYRHGEVDWIRAYDEIRTNTNAYEQLAVFDSSFVNKEFYRSLDPMFAGYFLSPRIEFYRARHEAPSTAIDVKHRTAPGQT